MNTQLPWTILWWFSDSVSYIQKYYVNYNDVSCNDLMSVIFSLIVHVAMFIQFPLSTEVYVWFNILEIDFISISYLIVHKSALWCIIVGFSLGNLSHHVLHWTFLLLNVFWGIGEILFYSSNASVGISGAWFHFFIAYNPIVWCIRKNELNEKSYYWWTF